VFTDILWMSLVAVGAPLVVALVPSLRIPAVVLEIVGGIIIGPQVLHVATPDVHVRMLATIGLAFLLFLAGLEVNLDSLRSPVAGLALRAFLVSIALAVGAGYLMKLAGTNEDPMLLAIIFVATSLGVVVPVLKDTGEIESEFGQLVFIAGSLAEFGSIFLLSLFFSKESSSPAASVLVLAGFGLLVAASSFAVGRAWRGRWLAAQMERLEDTSSMLRVRAAIAILFLFAVLANHLALEAILGTFIAGALVRVLDRGNVMVSDHLRDRLDAIGFGFVVPFFFVATGMRLDVDALFSGWGPAKELALFFLALLFVRGLPALLYRPRFGTRRSYVAGLMQATSLTFIVVAADLGRQLHKIDAPTEASLIAAGLLSVLLFPALALILSTRQERELDVVAIPLERELEAD
jgi:Kef-type K+ transport system membrane component KefB